MVWQKKSERIRLRINLLFIICFFTVSSYLTGQTFRSSDDISNRDSVYINSLLDSCWIYRTSEPLLALEYGNNALKLIADKKITPLKPKALNYLGVVYRKLGNLEESYIYFGQALNLATILNDSVQIGYTYNNFADYYLKKASRNEKIIYIIKEIENRNLKILDCNLCRYHALNNRKKSSKAIFCKFRRILINSDKAFNCEYFKTFKK